MMYNQTIGGQNDRNVLGGLLLRIRSGKNASAEEIKSAYHELVKIYHPDKCDFEFALDIFTKINEAYSVLGDEAKRAIYDYNMGKSNKLCPSIKENGVENEESVTIIRGRRRRTPGQERKGNGKKILKWTGAVLGLIAVSAVVTYSALKFASPNNTKTSAPGSDIEGQKIEQTVPAVPSETQPELSGKSDADYESQPSNEPSEEVSKDIKNNPHANNDTDSDDIETEEKSREK